MSETRTTKHRRDVGVAALALLCSAVLAVVVGGGTFFWQELEQTKTANAATAKGLDEANRRLIAAGKTPVPIPSVPPAATGDDLSAAQLATVRQVVNDQLARQKVSLTQEEISQVARAAAALIPKPKDGATPTAAQLRPLAVAAVAAYCTADRCVGKQGGEGKPGASVTGPRGEDAPPVSDEELFAQAQKALLAYCSLDSKPCQGTAGPTGPVGPQGPAAVSISDTDCIGTGAESYWRITYSDDTTGTSSGPCRIAIVPPVTPPTEGETK